MFTAGPIAVLSDLLESVLNGSRHRFTSTLFWVERHPQATLLIDDEEVQLNPIGEATGAMLDRKFILDNIEAVKKNCRDRGVPEEVDRMVELELERRNLLKQAEEFNRLANETSKGIGKATSDAQREAMKEQGRKLREQKEQAQSAHDALEVQIQEIQARLPNMAHPAAPIGKDDHANLEVALGKTPIRQFDFPPKDHVQLGQQLDLIDFEAGARVAGAGFYFLKREAVLLEIALQQFALHHLMQRGFIPITTPDVAHTGILRGIGTLGGMYAGEVFEAEQLPLRLVGISHCFRTEAGAAGRASKGLYRVHQFTKIEMFGFTLPEQSDRLHEELRELECLLFDELGIPYRVVDTATGDLGGPAYRKYDLEAWMPGRGEAGEWGEVTSTSNCTDYQARRLNIRYRVKGEKGTHLVHTLNGTAIAISRALIAILENYQQSDGSIVVPEALRRWMGIDRIGPR